MMSEEDFEALRAMCLLAKVHAALAFPIGECLTGF